VFDAAVYPSLVVARRTAPAERTDSVTPGAPAANGRRNGHARNGRGRNGHARHGDDGARPGPSTVAAALHRKEGALRWEIPAWALPLDPDPGSPWLAAPTEVRSAFDRLARAGVPLAESPLGRPYLGIKCGCNEAFVVRVAACDGGLAHVRSGARSGTVERALLRPLLRGESITRWKPEPGDEHLVWTHSDDGAPLARLPQHAERWLAQWKRALLARTDVHGRAAWWSLFRTATASSRTARVVWADFARSPRALVLPAGHPAVALNSCYVLPCPERADAYAFAALLNSALAAAWLHLLAEPARGGYKRYLAWTVALLPVPRDWPAARAILAPVAERAAHGGVVPDVELLDAALRAYRVRHADLAPLLAWSAR
jgi:hypothetical protein